MLFAKLYLDDLRNIIISLLLSFHSLHPRIFSFLLLRAVEYTELSHWHGHALNHNHLLTS